MACRDGACGNDGLSFVLEMVRLLLLRSNLVVCQDVVEDGFLSDGLFPSSKCFFSLDDIPSKSLEFISIVCSAMEEGS